MWTNVDKLTKTGLARVALPCCKSRWAADAAPARRDLLPLTPPADREIGRADEPAAPGTH
jgi:hypothetical protein